MTLRPERRTHVRQVHVDRRKGDAEVIDHVVRGIRLVERRATSADGPHRRRRDDRPWTCPSCRHPITHGDTTPRSDVRYRCHVCRVDLEFNGDREGFVIAADDEWSPGDMKTPSPDR